MSNSAYLERVKPYIGMSVENGSYVVDASQIRQFAAATLETNPIYFDEAYAKTTPYGGMIAPPTFYRVWGTPPIHPVEGAALPVRGAIHAKEDIRVCKPIHAGDRVTVRTTFKDAFEKEGRSGYLLFVVMEQAILDESGEPYTISYNTRIYDKPLLETKEASFYSPTAMIANGDWLAGFVPANAETVQPGDEIGPVTFPEVTRNWIAQWAGASTDFNPIHLDDAKARAAGHDGVIAHGMLSAATVNTLSDLWLGGPNCLEESSVKFVHPVHPGDRLTFRGRVTGVERSGEKVRAAWSYTVVNEAGVPVLEGSAAGVLA